jgi:hypothetical protein
MSDTGILDGIPPEFSSDFYKSDFDQDFIDNIRATIERDPNRALDPMDTGGAGREIPQYAPQQSRDSDSKLPSTPEDRGAELNEKLAKDSFYRNLGSEEAKKLYREYMKNKLFGRGAFGSFIDWVNSDPSRDFRTPGMPDSTPIDAEDLQKIYANEAERKALSEKLGRDVTGAEFYARPSSNIIGRIPQKVFEELNASGAGLIDMATITPDELTIADLRHLGITLEQAQYIFNTTATNVAEDVAANWMKRFKESGTGTQQDPKKDRTYEGVISSKDYADFDAGKDVVIEQNGEYFVINKKTHDWEEGNVNVDFDGSYGIFAAKDDTFDNERRGGGGGGGSSAADDSSSDDSSSDDSSSDDSSSDDSSSDDSATDDSANEGDPTERSATDKFETAMANLENIETFEKELPEDIKEKVFVIEDELLEDPIWITTEPKGKTKEDIAEFCRMHPDWCKKFEARTGKPYNGELIGVQVPSDRYYNPDEKASLEEISKTQTELEDAKQQQEEAGVPTSDLDERLQERRARIQSIRRKARTRWLTSKASDWYQIYVDLTKQDDGTTDDGTTDDGTTDDGTTDDGTTDDGTTDDGTTDDGTTDDGTTDDGTTDDGTTDDGTTDDGTTDDGTTDDGKGKGKGGGKGSGQGTGTGSGQGEGTGAGTGTGVRRAMRVRTATPEERDVVDIDYFYDWASIFANPKQAKKFAEARSSVTDLLIDTLAKNRKRLDNIGKQAAELRDPLVGGIVSVRDRT